MSIHQTAPVSLLSMNGQFVALAAASCSTAGGKTHLVNLLLSRNLKHPAHLWLGAASCQGFCRALMSRSSASICLLVLMISWDTSSVAACDTCQATAGHSQSCLTLLMPTARPHRLGEQ